jgi:hypothetical protein
MRLLNVASRILSLSRKELILLLGGALAVYLNLRYIDIRAFYAWHTGRPLPVEHVNIFDYTPTLLGIMIIIEASLSLVRKWATRSRGFRGYH